MQVNHLPYMPFPPNWPTYIPKDKLAGWFEAYVESLELNYWTGTEFEGGRYDETARPLDGHAAPRRRHDAHDAAAPHRDGDRRQRHSRTSRTSRRSKDFARHGAALQPVRRRRRLAGKRALVIGTGNSGHDIAQDLQSSGAEVTLVQRSPTLIVNIEPSAQLPYALYDEGPPLEDCDLITVVDAAGARRARATSSLTEQRASSSTSRCSTGSSASASGSTSARTAPAGSSST